jgi:feruloyl-CoA synthase
VYFNVPKGFEELLAYLRCEPELRQRFFSRLEIIFYSGASLAQHVWDGLNELAIETVGARVPIITGLGSTETAPSSLICGAEVPGAGIVGLPHPGVELKLVPTADKLEARLRGPNIMPGYWGEPALSATAFDEEGFYQLGDALAFVDESAPQKGFRFDGRVSEDFKLATGTWVSVGPLRARVVAALAPYIRDVVVAGADKDYLAVILVPDLPATGQLDDEALRAALASKLTSLAASAGGSSNRVRRAILIDGALSFDIGEVTDKGSINQRAVLKARRHLVEALYAAEAPSDVIAV